jgi:hypothetical protein
VTVAASPGRRRFAHALQARRFARELVQIRGDLRALFEVMLGVGPQAGLETADARRELANAAGYIGGEAGCGEGQRARSPTLAFRKYLPAAVAVKGFAQRAEPPSTSSLRYWPRRFPPE